MTIAKPSHFSLKTAIRANILELLPYRCARDDYSEGILLDANENALGHALPPATSESTEDHSFDSLSLNRYPSPSHLPLKQLLCDYRHVTSPDHVFLGVGSDEVIDLLFRISCVPGKDRVLICPPTYGMYGVCAKVNDVEVVKVDLNVEGEERFQAKVDLINQTISAAANTPSPIKLLFLCSPGNPTGTLIPLDSIRSILSNPDYNGLVVVDEAYIDFSDQSKSAVRLLIDEGWSNLVIMQTLSKGFGLAAIRLGVAYSSPPLIQILNNIKAPYNISTPTAALALRALSSEGLALLATKITTLKANHASLHAALLTLPNVLQILGSGNANFLLAQIGTNGIPDNRKAERIYKAMAEKEKVVVRFRGNEVGCEGCLRITVGTSEECEVVINKLRVALTE